MLHLPPRYFTRLRLGWQVDITGWVDPLVLRLTCCSLCAAIYSCLLILTSCRGSTDYDGSIHTVTIYNCTLIIRRPAPSSCQSAALRKFSNMFGSGVTLCVLQFSDVFPSCYDNDAQMVLTVVSAGIDLGQIKPAIGRTEMPPHSVDPAEGQTGQKHYNL